MADMERNGIRFIHTRRIPTAESLRAEEPGKGHRHDLYEIYRFLSGDADYFIENRLYGLQPGDLLVIRSDEFHHLSVKSATLYEKTAVRFPKELARLLSAYGTDLLACFDERAAGTRNRIVPMEEDARRISEVLVRLEALCLDGAEESAALRVAALLELLVLINRAWRCMGREPAPEPSVPLKLEPILAHIEENLQADLTLQALARRFYVSVSALCALFRETTGTGPHEYVTYRRVARAREALTAGASVGEACAAGGFNDYANFIRTFRKVMGVPPGRFGRMNRVK